MRNRLFDRAQFWVLFTGAVGLIGGIFTAIGVARTPAGHELWSEGWFVVGIGAIFVGVLCLLWGLVLFLAHRHAEGHMCPDPDAHRAASAAGTTPWPSQPILVVEQGTASGETRIRAMTTELPVSDQSEPPVQSPERAADGSSDAHQHDAGDSQAGH